MPESSTMRPLTRPDACEVVDWQCQQPPHSDLAGGAFAAAIGNFDGVHLGHRKLIAGAMAHGKGLAPAVITFAPHPRRYFRPDDPPFALTDDADKLALLAELGVARVIRLRFDDAMRQTSAEDFVREILPALGVRALYGGADFTFGAGRGGDMKLMQKLGGEVGISAHETALENHQGTVLSSSRIRQAISQGAMQEARAMLGRPYTISGEVMHGDKRGAGLGFPTANLLMGDYQHPPLGVYAVAAAFPEQPQNAVLAGVANIGKRPSFDGESVRLEVHLFNFDCEIYGQRLNIFCLNFIRSERKFDNVDALRHQIAQDVESAHAFHARTNEQSYDQ